MLVFASRSFLQGPFSSDGAPPEALHEYLLSRRLGWPVASPPGDRSAMCRLGLVCPERGGRYIVGAQNRALEQVQAAGARAHPKGSSGSNPLSNGNSLPCWAAGLAFDSLPCSIPWGREAFSPTRRQVK